MASGHWNNSRDFMALLPPRGETELAFASTGELSLWQYSFCLMMNKGSYKLTKSVFSFPPQYYSFHFFISAQTMKLCWHIRERERERERYNMVTQGQLKRLVLQRLVKTD